MKNFTKNKHNLPNPPSEGGNCHISCVPSLVRRAREVGASVPSLRRRVREVGALCLFSTLFTLGISEVKSQTLLIDPPRKHLDNRPFNGIETHTISLMVDFGIERAVAWGTDITLANTSILEFVPDFGGTGVPFKSTQSFFETDFSDYSDAPIGDGDAILHLNYMNFSDPTSVFGKTGLVTLGQFQVRVKGEPNYPEGANFGGLISLSGLDIPPDGSAVQDSDGNNLLLAVNNGVITSRPPTPEPSAWLTILSGVGIGTLMLRRKQRRTIQSNEETHTL